MKRSENNSQFQIEYTTFFLRQRKRAPLEIRIAFRESLALFIEDQSHPSLRNHPLKKKLAGYNSIDVTDDWRAVFKEAQTGERIVITFHKIGTHKDLYKR